MDGSPDSRAWPGPTPDPGPAPRPDPDPTPDPHRTPDPGPAPRPGPGPTPDPGRQTPDPPRPPGRRGWPDRRAWLALAVAGVVIALTGVAFIVGSRTRAEPTGGAASAGHHVYLLEPSAGSRSRVSLEVAADEASRERGLSHRTELAAGTGMVFLFPAETQAAFWMKDTLVPLQIAFVGGDGRVVGLFEMPPCRADPCPTYAPTRPYRYAVELPSGAFTAAGVRQGDRVVPQDPAALPGVS